MSNLKSYLIPLYKSWKHLESRIRIQKQIKNLINDDKRVDCICPVCGNKSCLNWVFIWEDKEYRKCYCLNCGHIFSTWLKKDLVKTQTLFEYEDRSEHNHKSRVEEECLRQLVFNSKKGQGKYLDFGVGRNMFIIDMIGAEYQEQKFYACDLNDREWNNYFVAYRDPGFLGFFDGIASHAVVEHLDDTLNSWEYFNKLLKPMAEGGGMMVHAFPSQIHFDMSDWSLKIPEHVCLFSRKSLGTICERTGFKLTGIKQSSGHHPLFFFRKIFDVKP